MKELLEAGVHFGHQVRRWNPKMKEYIFGERNGIYIIDLQKTQKMFREALQAVTNMVAKDRGKTVLFVGTKRQAQDAVREEAERAGQFYVNQQWLGGLLTNFQSVQKSIKRLKDLETMQSDGRYEKFSKKERAKLDRERQALEKTLSGIKGMSRLPDAVFVIDVQKEEIAVAEANKLGIPVIAVVDTNCSPEGVDYVIPGNDESLRAVRLFASRLADAVLEGQQSLADNDALSVMAPPAYESPIELRECEPSADESLEHSGSLMDLQQILREIQPQSGPGTSERVMDVLREELPARKYVIHRYQTLIDRQYVGGLSPNEREELEALKITLDEMDVAYYERIIGRLRHLILDRRLTEESHAPVGN